MNPSLPHRRRVTLWPLGLALTLSGAAHAAPFTLDAAPGDVVQIRNGAKQPIATFHDDRRVTLEHLPQQATGDVVCAQADGALGRCTVVGQPGDKGDKGDKGDPGSAGAPGAAGAIGPMGPAGAASQQGAAGPIGPQGPKGDPGVAGPAGPVGPAGGTGGGAQVKEAVRNGRGSVVASASASCDSGQVALSGYGRVEGKSGAAIVTQVSSNLQAAPAGQLPSTWEVSFRNTLGLTDNWRVIAAVICLPVSP